jgi:hypothetical protein
MVLLVDAAGARDFADDVISFRFVVLARRAALLDK